MIDSLRKHSPYAALQSRFFQRRRAGAITLAVVALMALLRLRSSCETLLSVGLEAIVAMLGLAAWALLQRRSAALNGNDARHSDAQRLMLFGLGLVIMPWGCAGSVANAWTGYRPGTSGHE